MSTIRCRNNQGGFSEIPKEKFFFRPSVYGLIVRDGKIVLMTCKSSNKFWFPGGGIEIGEKIEDALTREILEETGLRVQIKDQIFFRDNFFYYEPDDDACHSFLVFYLCTPVEGSGLFSDGKVEDDEVKEPRWIEIKNLKPEDFQDIPEDCMNLIKSLTKNEN